LTAAVKYTYYDALNGGVSGEALDGKPTTAGSYIVVATINESANFVSASASYTFTIQEKVEENNSALPEGEE
jgi:hypothetical protein